MAEFRVVNKPYPGLRPFESWEGEIFFGREAHTDRLLEILQQQHFLAVIGPSGSGKSSLVRAGLLPVLPLGSIGTGNDWRIVTIRPGNRPLQRLANALLAQSALGIELVGAERVPKNDRDITTDVAMVEAELRRGPRGLVDLVLDARSKGDPSHPFNLMVLVDQFEEIFTYADAGVRQVDESEAFVNLLLESRNAKDGRIFITLTMRTDFLGNCVRFLELPDAINRAQYLTPRLNREQTELAITGPARVFGGDVETTLVTELINTVGNDPDQLPILQHALARMWEISKQRNGNDPTLSWKDFDASGGARTALSQHADQVLDSLGPENKPLAELLFRAITEQRTAEAGSQAVRRPQSLAQIAAWSGRKWKDFEPVVKVFAAEDVNFLTCSEPLTEDSVVDISHEALIRQWTTLRGWVEVEGRRATEYRRWRDRAESWTAGESDLLTGADLARAIEWRSGKSDGNTSFNWRPTTEWAARYGRMSERQLEDEFTKVTSFLDDSQEVKARSERRERRLKRWLIGLTLSSILATIVAVSLAYFAFDRETFSTAIGYWYPFTFESSFTEAEANVLLKLARDRTSVKRRFIEQVLRDSQLAERFDVKPVAIADGAIGVSLNMRSWVLARIDSVEVKDLSDAIRTARALLYLMLDDQKAIDHLLAAIKATLNHGELWNLGSGLISAAEKLSDAEARSLADSLLAAIEEVSNIDQFLALARGMEPLTRKVSEAQLKTFVNALLKEITKGANARSGEVYEHLELLIQSLRQLIGNVTEIQAKIFVDTVLVAIQNAKERDFYLKSTLSWNLAAAAGKVSETDANALVDTLLQEIRSTTDRDRAFAFREALTTAAGKVSETKANALVDTLLQEIRRTTDRDRIMVFSQVLATAAGKVSETKASAIVDTLFQEMKRATDPNRIMIFSQILATAGGKVSTTQAKVIVDTLLPAIEDTKRESNFSPGLTVGLVAVAGKVSETQAKAIANALIAGIKDDNSRGPLAETLGGRLAELAGKVSETQAKVLADSLITTIDEKVTFYQSLALGQGLAAAVGKVSEAQAKALADSLIAAIKKSVTFYQSLALGQGLAAAVGKVSETQAQAFVDTLLAAIKSATDGSQLEALGRGLAAAIARSKLSNSLTKELINIMKYPGLPRGEFVASIRKHFRDAPPEKEGFWAFILWAQNKFPELDLDSPPL